MNEVPYWEIPSQLEEISATERNFGKSYKQKLPYKPAILQKTFSVKTASEIVPLNAKPESKNLNVGQPKYDAYMERYGGITNQKTKQLRLSDNTPIRMWGDNITRAQGKSIAMSVQPQLQSEMEPDIIVSRAPKYAEAIRIPLEIKTESDILNKFMVGWNESFRTPDALTAWRNGTARYYDIAGSPSISVLQKSDVAVGKQVALATLSDASYLTDTDVYTDTILGKQVITAGFFNDILGKQVGTPVPNIIPETQPYTGGLPKFEPFPDIPPPPPFEPKKFFFPPFGAGPEFGHGPVSGAGARYRKKNYQNAVVDIQYLIGLSQSSAKRGSKKVGRNILNDFKM
jgi:hypothetical protein